MIRRPGVTLVEVLVAIFIMAIGLLSLLTLFPLGALSMAQAIKDERAAQAAANAAAIARIRQVDKDPLLFDPNNPGLSNAYINSNPGVLPDMANVNVANNYPFQLPGQPVNNPMPTPYIGPSYPVFIDPIGRAGGATRLGGGLGNGMARRSVSFVGSSYDLANWFTLLDDITFPRDVGALGVPDPAGKVVARDGKYTYAYLVRLRNWQTATGGVRVGAVATPEWSASDVELTVVVFSGRSLATPLLGENTYPGIDFFADSNQVTVTWGAGQERPPLRKGGWILDATVAKRTGYPAGRPQVYPDPHGSFYRVVGITDVNANTIVLDLQTPIKQNSGQVPNGRQGVLVVLENVVEVIEKDTAWMQP